jgi:hypothetical protein
VIEEGERDDGDGEEHKNSESGEGKLNFKDLQKGTKNNGDGMAVKDRQK